MSAKLYDIKDIYSYDKAGNVMMLSSYPAAFWKPYRDNHAYFDRRFKSMYKSFFPFDQDDVDDIAEAASNFTYDVYAHMLANDKRYSELFRIETIPDDTAYSLTNNVDYTETLERTEDRSGQDIKGSEQISDTGSNVYGQQTISEDTDIDYGQRTETKDNDFISGARADTTDNSKSAYNEGTYTPTDRSELSKGEQTDHTDDEISYSAHSDSQNREIVNGSHTDTNSNTRTEGQRTDTHSDDADIDQTIHKVGNMGVQTVDDMLLKHWDNWNLFKFYDLIFSEIAENLLRLR